LAQSTVLAIDSYYNNSIKDAYSYPDLFISPSHFLANQFGKMGFKYPIKVIHNPFNTEAFTKRKSHSKKQHAVLYAGRFSVDKGIALYLNLAKQFSDITFLIAGAGDVEDDVRKADREMANVEYLGSLNREQLFNTFDKVDYLILPSIWYENNPNIIIEAMSFGLPVIGSNLGGIPELIGGGRGFLFDPLKPASLPDLMKSLDTLSPEAYQEVSEKSMAFAQTLSFENYYNQLSAIIPELKLDPVLQ
jgi:glycosyltransferase involved in cell wall biosynthesis